MFRVFYSKNKIFFVNYYNRKLAYNLNLSVKRAPSLPISFTSRKELCDLKNLIGYVEKQEARRVSKNSGGESVKGKRIKQIQKPSISWINSLAEPNTAYAYMHQDDAVAKHTENMCQKGMPSFTPEVRLLPMSSNLKNLTKKGAANDKKISFSSQLTDLGMFDNTNC
jgi:hypothetical protein